MPGPKQEIFEPTPDWAQTLQTAGLHAAADFFTHPKIKVWRSIPERENCTLDLAPTHIPTESPSGSASGSAPRLHVKRLGSSRSRTSPASEEIAGWKLLLGAGVPTLQFAAWGELPDGRSFTAAVDLDGYESGQSLLRRGVPFAALSSQTARLAGLLHSAGLYHRDLYLCHFFLHTSGATSEPSDARLIDVARVRRLPWFMSKRWIVKDLAQFRYSAGEFQIPEPELDAWLSEYCKVRKVSPSSLRPAILRKVATIARHDRNLRARQPTRNISIPTAGALADEPSGEVGRR